MPYLIKKLTLNNFKSYLGKHEIFFDEKFTIVVGPNGSGKSNIFDALQFLFGKRAKKMRQNILKNLINEQSKEGAFVQLILSIGEKEILLERNIDLSGKSNYKINNSLFTQEKYLEYLYGLKIDTRTNRFLILQGEIENITQMDSIKLLNYLESLIGTDIYIEMIEQEKNHHRILENQFLMKQSAFDFSKNEFLFFQKEYLKERDILKAYTEYSTKVYIYNKLFAEYLKTKTAENQLKEKEIMQKIKCIKEKLNHLIGDKRKSKVQLTEERHKYFTEKKLREEINDQFTAVTKYIDKGRSLFNLDILGDEKKNKILLNEVNEKINLHDHKSMHNLLKLEKQLNKLHNENRKFEEFNRRRDVFISNNRIYLEKSDNILVENEKLKFKNSFDLKKINISIENLQRENLALQRKKNVFTSKINNNEILRILKDIDIVGRVGDLFQIHEKYKLAVGSAMRGVLDSIVVEKREYALQAIPLLKQKRKRVNFIILDELKIKSRGGENNLINMIHTSNELLPVFHHILQNTLVVNNIKDALYYANNKNIRAVSLRGELVETNGLMSKKINNNVSIFKNQCTIKNCIYCKNGGNENNSQSVNNINKNLNELLEEEKKINLQLCILKVEKEADDFKIMQNFTPTEDLENKIADEKKKLCVDEIKKLKKEKLELENKIWKINKQKNEMANIKRDGEKFIFKYYKKKEDDLQKIFLLLNGTLKNLRWEIEKYDEKITKQEESIGILNKQLAKINDKEKMMLEEEILLNEEIKSLIIKFKKFTGKFHENLVEKEKIDFSNYDFEILHDEIYKMNKLINEPNFDLIESFNMKEKEFKKVESEYIELKEKLNYASEKIESLKNDRLEKFMHEFNLINAKFKEIFCTLTFGGNCDIEFVDYLNVFNGLRISIMPPKKTWKSIYHLSGGEKTLASLSLIFAIQSIKPAPFYIMDEIDAALDFRNVSIIANYLKLINVQFLIISLRTDMVELGNHLVGVFKKNNISNLIFFSVK